ncbi:GNAT family N-acetyltransferase [Bacillus canaveralius]|uniref:GNAT family N-acetyltransferase n=1 Tax=Bacillus canaveralius TaxID=1403243 RepID=A0A2N5GKN5_9BACI|nr:MULTISPECIES: GNAT family N-acetyltransferase [Bacillus]PLR81461.1 GNAT family N-acetyltransferase [Bacillus sp. V33-4]PLR82071.1 GNAT family N-acetyltransferase [Bacillus canaveralius]PLR98023.1 GNAT family N-acetyltransferase [Bacillus canaveralius]RSK54396.1 GNAT family N-acetyltransferase [Bacillus canaveralius]
MKVTTVSTEQELEDAFTVRKKVFVEEQQVPEEEEIDQFESNAVHFVLYDGETPAGAGRFRVVDGFGKVERICVLQEYRKTGAGKAIMAAIEAYAAGNGISALKLNAQTHAIPFYSRLGYEVVSGEFLDAGIPHKTMKKFTK